MKGLAELFHASTLGFNPMSLDWDFDDNKALLGHDLESVAAIAKATRTVPRVLRALYSLHLIGTNSNPRAFLHEYKCIRF